MNKNTGILSKGNKLLKITLASALILTIATTSASADPVKGQKLFLKKLKKVCGINGAKFTAMNSQDKWEELKKAGKFEDEIIRICPNVKRGEIKESWQEHIYDFSYEFANDSGNVPTC